MVIRRGDVYDYELPTLRARATRSTKRLIITADDLNAEPEQMLMVGLHVRDDDPGGLLAVRVGHEGWVSVLHIERLLPSAIKELRYHASSEELEQITSAMRVAYDLLG